MNALQEVFNFTPADLRDNQNGLISDAQKQRIQDEHFENSRSAWYFLLFITVIGLFGSGGAAISEGIPILEMWLGLAITILAFGIVIWAGIVYYRSQMYRTLRQGKVEEVQGQIWLVREGTKPVSHYLRIGGHEFHITSRKYYKLKSASLNGKQATVYYSRPWHGLLSVQLLS